MKHPKLKRLKEGAVFATFFIGFNIIKNFIFDFSDTITLFREVWKNMSIAMPIFIINFCQSMAAFDSYYWWRLNRIRLFQEEKVSLM